jgi:O-antigen/teichoic acid export membrane protein
MKKTNIISHNSSLLVLLDQTIFSGTNFLLTLFLAKQLNTNEFGIFSALVIATYLGLTFMNAIIIQPFQVLISTVKNKKEYFVFLFFVQLILLVIISCITYGFSLFLNEIIFQPLTFIFFITTYIFQDFFRKIGLGIQKIKWVLYIDLFFVINIVIGFYIVINDFNLNNSLFIISISNLISSSIGILSIITIYKFPKHWKKYLSLHTNESKWLLSVASLQWASSNFIILLSGIYISIESLGALRLVQSFFGILNIMLQTVENYFLPKIAALYHTNKKNAKHYLLKVTSYSALIFGSILTFIYVFASKIIILAGGIQYEKYVFVVRIMTVLYFFIFISYPFRIIIRVMLLNKIFFIGYLISFIFSLATFHMLLKFWGLSGALLGLILNQIIMIGYWQIQLKKNQYLLWK